MARSKRRSADRIARSDASQQDGRPVQNLTPGGSTNQVLEKASAADGDAHWVTPPATVPSTRQVIAGAGLTGGGDLSADRTLNVGAGTGVQVNADDIAVKYGTTAGTAAQGNDARLSDARAPTGHHVSHEDGGADEVSVTGLSGVLADPQHPIIGAGATQAVAGNDARLTDTRTPTDNTVSTVKLVDGAVTLSKMSPMTGMPTGRVIGIPDGAALGDPQELTFNQIMELVHASADGDIVIRSGGAWIRLPKGTDGQVLVLAAGIPTWGSPGAGSGWTTLYKSIDQTKTTDTTMAADSELSFAMSAATSYALRGQIFVSYTAAGFLKTIFAGPASPTNVYHHRNQLFSGGSASEDMTAVNYPAQLNFASGSSGMLQFEGLVQNGANAGTWSLQWAQIVASGSATVKKGSWLEWRQI